MKKIILSLAIGAGASGLIGYGVHEHQEQQTEKVQKELETTITELKHTTKELKINFEQNKAYKLKISEQDTTINQLQAEKNNALNEITQLKNKNIQLSEELKQAKK